jgi:hypothetical protein
MTEGVWALVGAVVAWIALMRWVLPRFGVKT